jgi:NADPH-dependent glutamate synthase beta subunit-like oxidoreductase
MSGKDISWTDLEKNYDACVLAVGLTEPNSVRAEGENKDGVCTGCRSCATSGWARRR